MNGVVEYVSRGIQRLTGYLPEEIAGRHFTEIVFPDDVPFILDEFKKILGEQYGPSDYRIVRKDGTSFYVQTNSKIVRKNGIPIGITGVLTDIDGLKMSEERLREQNARYETLNSKLAAKNEELESMYEEIMAANEELEATNQELVVMQQTLLDANVRHEKSELRYRTLFEHSPIPIFEGDGVNLKVLVDEMRQSGVQDFAAYFREHPGAIWQFVAMIRILSVNRAFLDLFETARDDIAALDIRKYFTDGTLRFFCGWLLELISGVYYSEGETELCTLSGKRIYAMLRMIVPDGYEDNWARILVSILISPKEKHSKKRCSSLRRWRR
jgi:PAS domain S-box-containing protein